MTDCLTRLQIDGYLRAVLTAEQRRIVEAHLADCDSCHDALVESEIDEILPPEGPAAAEAPPAVLPQARQIGPYKLLRELGRGGQARVYLAEDTRLPRRVALKVFHADVLASESMLLRFQREAAALSRLDHPGICVVHETGEWEGCYYIAMRHVEGETLAQWIARSADEEQRGGVANSERTAQVVCLLERAARALHSAHQAGLVHRDIKPSNILIAADGQPVIVDFGLARDEEPLARTLTRTGDIAGTPVYMSPEQVRGERSLMDRRSDIFSLGVTLYEALTLTLPFDAPTTAGVFQKILAGHVADPSGATHVLPRDLRVILATALESDRLRRYQTALALAEDLRRWREHETILARPAGSGLRLRRWTQRNPVIAVAIVAVFLILASGFGISITLLERVHRESVSRAEALEREAGIRLAYQSSAVLRENPGQALLLAVEAARRAPSFAANNALMGAIVDCHERARLQGHTGSVNMASFSADGSRVVTAGQDSTARIWNARTGAILAVARGHDAAVMTAEFNPDGSTILTSAEDRTARIWEAASGNELVCLRGHESGLRLARFHQDGSRVMTVGTNSVRIWDSGSGAALLLISEHVPVNSARFSPDGGRILIGSSNKTATVWDTTSGALVVKMIGHEQAILDAQFSDDGKVIITGAIDGVARIWEAESGKLLSTLKGHEYAIYSVALSPDGRLAATGSEDFTARLWEARTGEERSVLRHDHKVIHLELSRDGTRLVTASYDRLARVWDTASGKLLATLKGHAAPLQHAAFSQAGESVVTSAVDLTARVWSVQRPWPVDALAGRSGVAGLAAMDPAGEFVATVEASGTAADAIVEATANPSRGRRTILSGHQGPITALGFSSDGKTLLTASKDATARLWDAVTGDLLLELAGHTAPVLNARFSLDGRRIATASEDHSLRIWDAATGLELAKVEGPQRPFFACTLSPDGERVIGGARDGYLCLADASSGKVEHVLADSGHPIRSVEWSPDGGRVVLAAFTIEVLVFKPATRERVGALNHASRATFAAYDPDGRWIATLCEDGIVRVWDAMTLEETLNLRREGFLTSATLAFVKASRQLAVLGWDAGSRNSATSRFLVYPLDPLSEAKGWLPAPLTPDERDQFRVGSVEERAAYRAAWSTERRG